MQAKVMLCHKSTDNFIVCMTDKGHFKYPTRLKNDKADKLINEVIKVGYIKTRYWKED